MDTVLYKCTTFSPLTSCPCAHIHVEEAVLRNLYEIGWLHGKIFDTIYATL